MSGCQTTRVQIVPQKAVTNERNKDCGKHIICGGGVMRYDRSQEIAITNLKAKIVDIENERDQLRAENERFRDGLKRIYDLVNDSNTQYAVELVITMQDEVQQALNEVTK